MQVLCQFVAKLRAENNFSMLGKCDFLAWDVKTRYCVKFKFGELFIHFSVDSVEWHWFHNQKLSGTFNKQETPTGLLFFPEQGARKAEQKISCELLGLFLISGHAFVDLTLRHSFAWKITRFQNQLGTENLGVQRILNKTETHSSDTN